MTDRERSRSPEPAADAPAPADTYPPPADNDAAPAAPEEEVKLYVGNLDYGT
jgi:hypothetical protein